MLLVPGLEAVSTGDFEGRGKSMSRSVPAAVIEHQQWSQLPVVSSGYTLSDLQRLRVFAPERLSVQT